MSHLCTQDYLSCRLDFIHAGSLFGGVNRATPKSSCPFHLTLPSSYSCFDASSPGAYDISERASTTH